MPFTRRAGSRPRSRRGDSRRHPARRPASLCRVQLPPMKHCPSVQNARAPGIFLALPFHSSPRPTVQSVAARARVSESGGGDVPHAGRSSLAGQPWHFELPHGSSNRLQPSPAGQARHLRGPVDESRASIAGGSAGSGCCARIARRQPILCPSRAPRRSIHAWGTESHRTTSDRKAALSYNCSPSGHGFRPAVLDDKAHLSRFLSPDSLLCDKSGSLKLTMRGRLVVPAVLPTSMDGAY